MFALFLPERDNASSFSPVWDDANGVDCNIFLRGRSILLLHCAVIGFSSEATLLLVMTGLVLPIEDLADLA
jgi:hypothetical protein